MRMERELVFVMTLKDVGCGSADSNNQVWVPLLTSQILCI